MKITFQHAILYFYNQSELKEYKGYICGLLELRLYDSLGQYTHVISYYYI